jgi:hypothetical protein
VFFFRTFPEAIVDCGSFNGKLLAPESCDELEKLNQEMTGPKEINPDQVRYPTDFLKINLMEDCSGVLFGSILARSQRG